MLQCAHITESGGCVVVRVREDLSPRSLGIQRDHTIQMITPSAMSDSSLDIDSAYNTALIASQRRSTLDSLMPATLMRPEPTV